MANGLKPIASSSPIAKKPFAGVASGARPVSGTNSGLPSTAYALAHSTKFGK
jgi:hypothetical protein